MNYSSMAAAAASVAVAVVRYGDGGVGDGGLVVNCYDKLIGCDAGGSVLDFKIFVVVACRRWFV